MDTEKAMFIVEICPHSYVYIEGCPLDDMPAVDFRRAAGLPTAACRTIDLPAIRLTSEAMVRRFGGDDAANLDLKGNLGTVSAEAIRPYLEQQTEETLTILLTGCREGHKRKRKGYWQAQAAEVSE